MRRVFPLLVALVLAMFAFASAFALNTGIKLALALPEGAVLEKIDPGEAAIADDEWERLIAGLSERERRMLQMLRDGHTHADTAAAFQLSEKTVQRLVRRLLSQGGSPGTPP